MSQAAIAFFEAPDFRSLFESAPDLYLVLSPDFSIMAVSDNYLKATMTRREEILGHNIFEVFPDNVDEPDATGVSNLRASLTRALTTKCADTMAIQKYDIPVPHSEGSGFEERYWSPMNTPVLRDGRVRYIIHRVEDVTEFVRLKQERIRQHKVTEDLKSQADHTERLRQAQRMEAMGQLAGGVAHDFNNMLAIIIMNCEMLLTRGTFPEGVRKSIEQVKKTGERAAALTRQLLAFSRKQVLQPKALNINSVVTDLEGMLRRLLVANIELDTRLAEDLGNTLADVGQIEQILLNLVVNARDAMPRGGKINIETANVLLDKATANGYPKVEPGPYIMLAVRDSGAGMDATTQARIFEPFFTTKGVGKGTGLGLATVFGIVSQTKGTIWVYSEPLKGTVFKIYLPLVQEQVENKTQSETPLESLRGNETVMVVEDQAELRQLVCETLKANGYECFEATNGAAALDLLKTASRTFHLVITDVVMPEMGGKVLAQKIKQISPEICLLYLSGYSEDSLVEVAGSETALHFLEKPFTVHDLLSKVRSVLTDRKS